jgi:hypothetical protein
VCESDEIGRRVGHVGKAKESCVEPSSGNRDAAPPKGDTADECLQNNRHFVLHSFLSLGIVTSPMETCQPGILYYLFLTIKNFGNLI